MKYPELAGKNVRVYFKPVESFERVYLYGFDDIKVGELKIVDNHYELYEIMLDIDRDELISEPYIFNESQIDSIHRLN